MIGRARAGGLASALLAVASASCGDLKGLYSPAPPLATYTVVVPGAPPSVTLAHPSVALIWAMQWLSEPLCFLPPENAQAQTALAAGCRDPFGFVPLRVEASVPIAIGQPTTLSLPNVPGSDVLVGDVTARVAYGSLVLYDDVDDDGTLMLARANRLGIVEGGSGGSGSGSGSGTGQPTLLTDVVYAASFVSMTLPDQRLGYREGAFNEAAAFYPRAGCGDPPPGFSVLVASGFTAQSAITATLAGMLPPETDVTQCAQGAPNAATIAVPLPAPNVDINEVACTENNADSEVRYREPQPTAPDLTGRLTACVHLPTLGSGSGSGSAQQIELIVTGIVTPSPNGPPLDSCKGLTHYILRGCNNDPNCAPPEWDHSGAPPSWWPCPTS
jgi:hypothetical protein